MQKSLTVKIFITAYYITMHLNKGLKEEWLIMTNSNDKILCNRIFTMFTGGNIYIA